MTPITGSSGAILSRVIAAGPVESRCRGGRAGRKRGAGRDHRWSVTSDTPLGGIGRFSVPMPRDGPKVSTGTSTDSEISDTHKVNAPCPDARQGLSGTVTAGVRPGPPG